jgi:hypothetical protein
VTLAKARSVPGHVEQTGVAQGPSIIVAGVPADLNVFNLDALAHIASAVFLISYLAVQGRSRA